MVDQDLMWLYTHCTALGMRKQADSKTMRDGMALFVADMHTGIHHCRNLLAVIHGDGGHYTEEHGIEKSCADAIEKVRALRVALDEREHDMHMRIRAGYDKTVADAWRAESARLQARIDTLMLEYCPDE